MEWEAAGIIVSAASFGEIDAIATVLTAEFGLQKGFVRAARSKRSRHAWEIGNQCQLRWSARSPDQLGSFASEVSDAPLARLVDRPMALSAVLSACALVAASHSEGVPAPGSFSGLRDLLQSAARVPNLVPAMIRWEIELLAELGYGLDLSGDPAWIEPLSFVSPRTGRAVPASVAGAWRDRLLPLPDFVLDAGQDPFATPVAMAQGLDLTGHFLLREIFAGEGRRMPAERQRLSLFVDRLDRDPGVTARLD